MNLQVATSSSVKIDSLSTIIINRRFSYKFGPRGKKFLARPVPREGKIAGGSKKGAIEEQSWGEQGKERRGTPENAERERLAPKHLRFLDYWGWDGMEWGSCLPTVPTSLSHSEFASDVKRRERRNVWRRKKVRYVLGTESGPPHNIRRPDDERRRMCLFSEPENVNYVGAGERGGRGKFSGGNMDRNNVLPFSLSLSLSLSLPPSPPPTS